MSQFSWNETNIIVNLKHSHSDILFNILIAIASLFIMSVNVSVIYWMVNKTRTLVNKMIIADCVANIGGLLTFAVQYSQLSQHVASCMSNHILKVFFFFLNRIVPITISTYRYILVCQNDLGMQGYVGSTSSPPV